MQKKGRKKTSYCTAQKEKSGKVADTRIESASLWYGENSSSNNFEEPGADLRREEMSLAFRRKAAKKNRGYKQRNAEMYAKMFSREMQPSILANPINLPPPALNP